MSLISWDIYNDDIMSNLNQIGSLLYGIRNLIVLLVVLAIVQLLIEVHKMRSDSVKKRYLNNAGPQRRNICKPEELIAQPTISIEGGQKSSMS